MTLSFADCVLCMMAASAFSIVALGEWRGLRAQGSRGEAAIWFVAGALALLVGLTALIAIYSYIQHWIEAFLSWRLY